MQFFILTFFLFTKIKNYSYAGFEIEDPKSRKDYFYELPKS